MSNEQEIPPRDAVNKDLSEFLCPEFRAQWGLVSSILEDAHAGATHDIAKAPSNTPSIILTAIVITLLGKTLADSGKLFACFASGVIMMCIVAQSIRKKEKKEIVDKFCIKQYWSRACKINWRNLLTFLDLIGLKCPPEKAGDITTYQVFDAIDSEMLRLANISVMFDKNGSPTPEAERAKKMMHGILAAAKRLAPNGKEWVLPWEEYFPPAASAARISQLAPAA